MLEVYTVMFCGDTRDENGMPEPYHSYLIIAGSAPALGESASIATVMTLTGAPELEFNHFPVSNGTPGAALEVAIDALASLQGNQGLTQDVNEMSA